MGIPFSKILAACLVVSTISFLVFTLPNGTLDNQAKQFFAATDYNQLGLLTSHFIFDDSNQFMIQAVLLLLLLACALALEAESPKFSSTGMFWIVVIPVIGLTLIKQAIAAQLGTGFYHAGPSIITFFHAGFLTIVAWKMMQARDKDVYHIIESIIALITRFKYFENRLVLTYTVLSLIVWTIVITGLPQLATLPSTPTDFGSLFAIACLFVGGGTAFLKKVHETDWLA